MRRQFFLLTLVAALAVIGVGCKHKTSANGGPTQVAIKTLEGKDLTVAQYKGKVVLVNFWATTKSPASLADCWDFRRRFCSTRTAKRSSGRPEQLRTKNTQRLSKETCRRNAGRTRFSKEVRSGVRRFEAPHAERRRCARI